VERLSRISRLHVHQGFFHGVNVFPGLPIERMLGTPEVKALFGGKGASPVGKLVLKTRSGYTLQVSSSGLSSAVSSAISVTKKASAVTVYNDDVASPSDLLLAPLVPDSQDLFDGLGLKKHARSI